jgi:hypothetical protein
MVNFYHVRLFNETAGQHVSRRDAPGISLSKKGETGKNGHNESSTNRRTENAAEGPGFSPGHALVPFCQVVIPAATEAAPSKAVWGFKITRTGILPSNRL